MEKSVMEEISDKVDTLGGEYMAKVIMTLRINDIENKLLKPEDILPLFIKRYDELGVIDYFDRNDDHPGKVVLPESFDVSTEDIFNFLDKIEFDEDYHARFEVAMLINQLEQTIIERITSGNIIRQRLFEKLYDNPASELPSGYRFHYSADIDYIRTQFPEIENYNLISDSTN
jgi:hypothetical protein